MMVRRVGLLINSDTHYTTELCKGAYEACLEYNIELVICYGGAMDNQEQNESYRQKMPAFSMIDDMELDFLIVPINTIFVQDDQAASEYLKSLKTPVILINKESRDHHYVVYNNESFYDAVSFMIEKGNRKEIGVITGSLSNTGSRKRLEAYKKALADHHYTIEEDLILDVDSYLHFDETLIEHWLDAHSNMDAIACVTDDIANSLYKLLKNRGYEIGKDILVCGFDNKPFAKNLNPPLASCQASHSLLTYMAVLKGLDYLKNGEKIEKYIDTYFIPRESIGYHVDQEKELYQFLEYCFQIDEDENDIARRMTSYIFENQFVNKSIIKHYFNEFFALLVLYSKVKLDEKQAYQLLKEWMEKIFEAKHLAYIDFEKVLLVLSVFIDYESKQGHIDHIRFYNQIYSNMILFFDRCYNDKVTQEQRELKGYDQLTQTILYASQNKGQVELVSSLNQLNIKNWDIFLYDKPIIRKEEFNKQKLIWKTHVRDGVLHHLHPDTIALNQIKMVQKVPLRFVTNLYFDDHQYGILSCQMDLTQIGMLDYIRNQISISLKMNETIHRLNLHAMIDELTQIYNRRGLYDQLTLLKANNQQEKVYFLLADIDNLKIINDAYGHEEGDKAIVLAAKVLSHVFRENSIVCRLGGDEFVVVFKAPPKHFIKKFDEIFNTVQDFYNEEVHYPYEVSLTYGISSFDLMDEDLDVEQMIQIADEFMYESKKKKKRGI